MPGELTELEFSLDDVIEGRPLTPKTVDLPTLRGFLEEVEKLIKGDVSGASLSDSRVRLEEGSVKLVTLVAHLLAEPILPTVVQRPARLPVLNLPCLICVHKWHFSWVLRVAKQIAKRCM